jgi:hypothetical protein
MPRAKTSRVSWGARAALLIPLPVIAALVWWVGQRPREGLFDSRALSQPGAPGVTVPELSVPAYLPDADFRIVDTTQVYTPETLYEKIDGHDAAFLRFGVVSLTFASYAGAGGTAVDVYAYRMNRRENALGVYAAERSEERQNLSIAEAGYKSGGAVFVSRGPYYLQIIPSVGGPAAEAAVSEIIDSLSQSIPAPVEPLAMLGRFPPEGRVPNSDGFFPDKAFGTEFVGEIFTTQYRVGDNTVTAFVHSSDSAQRMYERYREFLGHSANALGVINIDAVEAQRFESYGEETWILLRDPTFAGFTGTLTLESGRELAKKLIAAFGKQR